MKSKPWYITQRNLFEILLNQTEIRLNSKRCPFAVPNQSVHGKYNLFSVLFNKIWKTFLCCRVGIWHVQLALAKLENSWAKHYIYLYIYVGILSYIFYQDIWSSPATSFRYSIKIFDLDIYLNIYTYFSSKCHIFYQDIWSWYTSWHIYLIYILKHILH